MNQRTVKTIFWPVLGVSCFFLATTMFFLIGGVINSRMEDYFLSAIVGIILFISAKTVVTNVTEIPRLAVLMMFFWPVVIILSVFLMFGHLTVLDGSVGQIFNYLRGMLDYRAREFPIPVDLRRSFFLSSGIVTAVIFVVAQIFTCILLFAGTMPKKDSAM